MAENTAVRQTIVQLLSHMRDGKEIREYLNRFSQVDQSRFAVVKIGGAVIRDDIEGLAAALSFLQTVGLAPVVVHGGGPQLDAALTAAGFGKDRVDGLRLTPEAAMPIIRDTLTELNLALVDAVRAAGGRAAAIPSGVFEAEALDEAVYGRVGSPTGVRQMMIDAAMRGGEAPIVACIGETSDGRPININADSAVRALVHELQPFKIIFLTETGALLDEDGDVLSTVNLASEFDDLMKAEWVAGGMRVKMIEIKHLLDDLPLSSSVSITRPEELAKELFTHAGAGTLVRRGERIDFLEAKSDIDAARLTELIERAFERPIVDGYWEALNFKGAVITERYRAAAILSEIEGAPYLDKFAVLDDAKGEGLARAVWTQLMEHSPRLYWRSRASNPINSFYFDACDGAVKRGDWIVFWTGDDIMADMQTRIERIAALPATLKS